MGLRQNRCDDFCHLWVDKKDVQRGAQIVSVLHSKEPIKDCPCCGAAAQAYKSDSRTTGHGTTENYIGVGCTMCRLKMESSHYTGCQEEERLVKVVTKWNTRHVD